MEHKYRDVVFQDTSSGKTFLTKSTAVTHQTIQWEDGKVYPLVKVEVSSDSHPAFTGKSREVSSEGRVAAFNKKYAKR